MQDLDVEAGFPISRLVPGKDAIQPDGRAATCLHVGPYAEIEPAFTGLSGWVKANGYEPTGIAYEMYLNDPSTTPPEDLRTLIFLPLKKW